jgi:hypothetical protein
VPHEYNPDYCSKPSDTFLEIVQERGLNLAEQFSEFLEIATWSQYQLEMFLKGTLELHQEDAEALEKFTGAPASFWMERDRQYREGLKAGKKEI